MLLAVKDKLVLSFRHGLNRLSLGRSSSLVPAHTHTSSLRFSHLLISEFVGQGLGRHLQLVATLLKVSIQIDGLQLGLFFFRVKLWRGRGSHSRLRADIRLHHFSW